MALYLYGEAARLNFPSKQTEYLKEDLEEYFRWYSEKKKIVTAGVYNLEDGLFSAVAVNTANRYDRPFCGVYLTAKEAAIARDLVCWLFNNFDEGYARFLNYPEELRAMERSAREERALHILKNGLHIHPFKTAYHGVDRNPETGRFVCYIHSAFAWHDVICSGIKDEVQAAILHDKIQFMLGRSDSINFPDRLSSYRRDPIIALYKRLTGRRRVRHNDFLGIIKKKGSFSFRIFIRKGEAFSTGGFVTREDARRARDVYLLLRFNRQDDVYDKNLIHEPRALLEAEYAALEASRTQRREQQKKGSAYYGVKKRPDYDAWISKLYVNGRAVTRTFPTELEAAQDYDRRAVERDPGCTRLNFPQPLQIAA